LTGHDLLEGWLLVECSLLLLIGARQVDGYPSRHGGAHRFEPTNERFRDPATGEMMRVWCSPLTGERDNQPDGESGDQEGN
jgi:hypothetical protein